MSKENNNKSPEEILAMAKEFEESAISKLEEANYLKLQAAEILDRHNKLLLNIKDKNIKFSDKPLSKERIHGVLSNVFEAILSPQCPDRCENCGKKNINNSVIKHSPKASLIQVIPYQAVPTYIRLYKQRYRCKQCNSTFSAHTYYVDENCYISQALKFSIAIKLKKKIST